jgi:hypothetical protein
MIGEAAVLTLGDIRLTSRVSMEGERQGKGGVVEIFLSAPITGIRFIVLADNMRSAIHRTSARDEGALRVL